MEIRGRLARTELGAALRDQRAEGTPIRPNGSRDHPRHLGDLHRVARVPRRFQWKYGDVSLRRRLYDARRTPAELTSLFANHAESHSWTKDAGPSTPEPWIGHHGGPAPPKT